MISEAHKLSIRDQCRLLSVNRSTLYKVRVCKDETYLCNIIADIYSRWPMYGYRRITVIMNRDHDISINKKKVQRLMRMMGLKAKYHGINTSKKNQQDKVYPYLLKDIEITAPNIAWQTDITYLRTSSGFIYLVALIDVYSRYVVGFRLSNSLCTHSCIDALEDAIAKHGKPQIINSDQGSQYTSELWIEKLTKEQIKLSMTGVGRCIDNVFIERLWRSLKHEGIYIYDWNTVKEIKDNIGKWIHWYNYQRPHQSLKYDVPATRYCGFMQNSTSFTQVHNTASLFDNFALQMEGKMTTM